MTALEWVLIALVAAIVLRATADRVWPPRWEHCEHCIEVEALREATVAGVRDLHDELTDLRRAAEAIRDRLDEGARR